jgi:hypothetical protein
MRLNFTQGILSYPAISNIQQFLVYGAQSVSLSTDSGKVDVVFAHKDVNYLFTETSTVSNAWINLLDFVDYWLYWDIDVRSGLRTFGATNIAPTYGPVAPTILIEGLHWFDTTTNTMFVYHLGAFRVVVRVFAAKVNTGTFFSLGNNSLSPYAGSQVGFVGSVVAGRILHDTTNKPIKKSSGAFLTTEDDVLVHGVSINSLKVDNIAIVVTADENISKNSVVVLSSFDHIRPAVYADTDTHVVAFALDDMLVGTSGPIVLQGIIQDPTWVLPTVGQRVWISPTIPGDIVVTNPHDTAPLTYPTNMSSIGKALSPTSIYFTNTG